MAAQDVLAVVDRLEGAGLAVWADGGSGVDALVGRQTRAHDDLDVVVLLDEVPAVESILSELGCLTAELQLETHAGYELDDDDRHDLALLQSLRR